MCCAQADRAAALPAAATAPPIAIAASAAVAPHAFSSRASISAHAATRPHPLASASAMRASSVPPDAGGVGAEAGDAPDAEASDRSCTNTDSSRNGGGGRRLYAELLGSSLERLHLHERLVPPPLGAAATAFGTGLPYAFGFGSMPTLPLRGSVQVPPGLVLPVPAHIYMQPSAGGAMAPASSAIALPLPASPPLLVPPLVLPFQASTAGGEAEGGEGVSARSGGTEVFTPVTTPRESLGRKLSELATLTQRVRSLQSERARIVGELHSIRVQLSVNQLQIEQLVRDEQQRIDRLGASPGGPLAQSRTPASKRMREPLPQQEMAPGAGGGGTGGRTSQVPPLRLPSASAGDSAAGTPRTPGTSTARSIAEAEAERERLLYHLRGLGQQLEARRTEFESLQSRLRDCVHDIEGLETLGLSREQVCLVSVALMVLCCVVHICTGNRYHFFFLLNLPYQRA